MNEVEVVENEKTNNANKTEIEVLLDTPIEWGRETIETVVIKRPKGKHLKNLGNDMKLKDFLFIASKCSGVSMSVFDEMDSPDVMKVVEAVGELL